MKKFSKLLLLFIIPIIIIAVSSEILIRNIPNSYIAKRVYLDNYSNEIETLILGSSHASMGINPSFFEGWCYNAAMTSQALDIDYEILKKYNDNWNNLKNIVIPIDYFTLTSYSSSGKEAWRIKDYINYYKLPIRGSINYRLEITARQSKTNVKRLYSYYFLHKSELYYSELGNEKFSLKKKTNFELIVSGENAVKRHTCSDYSFLQKNLTILKNIINFSSDKNVKLILYTSPGYFTYTSLLDKTQMNLVVNSVTQLVKEHPNCYYFNFLTDDYFIKGDFYDGDHLNEIGAKKLSELINRKVNCL